MPKCKSNSSFSRWLRHPLHRVWSSFQYSSFSRLLYPPPATPAKTSHHRPLQMVPPRAGLLRSAPSASDSTLPSRTSPPPPPRRRCHPHPYRLIAVVVLAATAALMPMVMLTFCLRCCRDHRRQRYLCLAQIGRISAARTGAGFCLRPGGTGPDPCPVAHSA